MIRTTILLALCAGIAAAPAGAQGPPAAPVVVENVREVELVLTTTFLGSTEPKRASLVAAAIEGQVVAYAIDEGMTVKQGSLLARLDDDILKLRLEEAADALEEIKELHRKATLDLKRAQLAFVTSRVNLLRAQARLRNALGLGVFRDEEESR